MLEVHCESGSRSSHSLQKTERDVCSLGQFHARHLSSHPLHSHSHSRELVLRRVNLSSLTQPLSHLYAQQCICWKIRPGFLLWLERQRSNLPHGDGFNSAAAPSRGPKPSHKPDLMHLIFFGTLFWMRARISGSLLCVGMARLDLFSIESAFGSIIEKFSLAPFLS